LRFLDCCRPTIAFVFYRRQPREPVLKLLIINPNTTEAVTDNLVAFARQLAAPGTEIIGTTAAFGAAYVGTRAESAIAGHAVLDALTRNMHGIDAAIVGSSSDSGLPGAREIAPFPVVGMTEAAVLTACMLGGGFSFVTSQARGSSIIRALVESYGLGSRLMSIRHGKHVPAGQPDQTAALLDALMSAATLAVTEDNADVVLVGGFAPLTLTGEISKRLGVPVLDGISCAVRMAEMLVRLGPVKATGGSYAKPAQRKQLGLKPDLTAVLEGEP
jgi:allantoin racemase